jgi:hypothetical protein
MTGRASEDARSCVHGQSLFEEAHFVENYFQQEQMEDDDEKRQCDPEDDRQTAKFMPVTMESEHVVRVRWS